MSPMERPTWLNAKGALLAALMVVVLLAEGVWGRGVSLVVWSERMDVWMDVL